MSGGLPLRSVFLSGHVSSRETRQNINVITATNTLFDVTGQTHASGGDFVRALICVGQALVQVFNDAGIASNWLV